MEIYTYLRNDHKKIIHLLNQVIQSKNIHKRQQYVNDLIIKLILHKKSEEATFYRAIKDHPRGKNCIQHGVEEHREIENALAKLSFYSLGSEEWLVQFGKLKQMVEHHIATEEEDIFTLAKTVLSRSETMNLTIEMENCKQAIINHGAIKIPEIKVIQKEEL